MESIKWKPICTSSKHVIRQQRKKQIASQNCHLFQLSQVLFVPYDEMVASSGKISKKLRNYMRSTFWGGGIFETSQNHNFDFKFVCFKAKGNLWV